MKILITGTTGYIGHQLAIEAARKGYIVHALVRDPGSPFVPQHPNIIAFKGDITDKTVVESAIAGCEKVIHSAAIASFSIKNRDMFYAVNVEGTRNVLEASLKHAVKRCVFTSTGAVLGPSGKHPLKENDPRIIAFENDYEISKHWAEQLLKEYVRKGLFAVIVAAPRVYGPGLQVNGNVFGRLLKTIIKTRTAFIPANGKAIANYAFVEDVVAGHFLALEKGIAGEKYILGGENLSYSSFFEMVKRYSDRKIRLIRLPVFFMKSWSFLYMLFAWLRGKQTNISPKVISRILQNRALSCEKAIRQLGYTVTPFAEGIQKTILHLQNKNHE